MGWSNHHTNGLIHYAPQQVYRGYALITNVSGHDSRLIDMEGRVCHAWHSDEGIGYAYLLPNGNLLLRTGPAAEEVSFLSRPERELLPIGGRTVAGAILELDWDSNVVWEYRYPLLHHDFERLPNGNTLVLTWELMPEDMVPKVKGGHGSEGGNEGMLGDTVREITPSGEVVYEWNSQEFLDFDKDRICFLEGRAEWTHQNTLNVTPEGDLVVSFRQTDTVGIVDRASGEFRWKWGPGNISHQHNPTMLDNGRVLIFDNGPLKSGFTHSRVIEVDPRHKQHRLGVPGRPTHFFLQLSHQRRRAAAQRQHPDMRGRPRPHLRGHAGQGNRLGVYQPVHGPQRLRCRWFNIRAGQLGIPRPPLRLRPSGAGGQGTRPGQVCQPEPALQLGSFNTRVTDLWRRCATCLPLFDSADRRTDQPSDCCCTQG